jgi:hypothetical protein
MEHKNKRRMRIMQIRIYCSIRHVNLIFSLSSSSNWKSENHFYLRKKSELPSLWLIFNTRVEYSHYYRRFISIWICITSSQVTHSIFTVVGHILLGLRRRVVHRMGQNYFLVLGLKRIRAESRCVSFSSFPFVWE